MSRNLVICCDGTNNQFGPENTSVVRLVQVLERESVPQIRSGPPADPLEASTEPASDRSPDAANVPSVAAAEPALNIGQANRMAVDDASPQQLLYYDPGVGTLPEPGLWSKLGKKFSQVMGLAFGIGLTRNVKEAYAYLMDHWEPGDRVFVFGFSRGAYTARVLAGLLHACGLLPGGSHNLVPYVMRLFQSVRGRKEVDAKSSYWRLCDEFRWTFARPVPGSEDERRFPIHFLGVWDTVSSVGWVWDPVRFPYTFRNPSISIVRHAIAIDERRWFYRQNRMEPAHEQQDFRELWFPGVHSDVGGGYPEQDGDYGLWRMPFEWMVAEAETAGLDVDVKRRHAVVSRTKPSPHPWLDGAHESLTLKWWPAEFFPKWQRLRADSQRRLPRIGLGQHRFVQEGALIQNSALLRIRDGSYAPPNLSSRFLKKVCDLTEVPEALPYEP